MATTSSEPKGGLQTPPLRQRAELTVSSFQARSDDKALTNKAEKLGASVWAGDTTKCQITFGPFRLIPARRLLLEGDMPVRIGSRALDLLLALVERHGELVSKSELIARVWRNMFVEEGNLKVQIATLRRALADGRGGNLYISTVAGQGYCFVAPVTRSPYPRPKASPHPSPQRLTNVPQPLMRLIGRDDIVNRVSAQLRDHRLITLVGPGGVGKTSVAVASAAGLTERYDHGVWFIDLAATTDPRLLSAEVAEVIRTDISEEDPTSSLMSYLSDKRMLLLFDNCEHIVDAVATLALQVMRGAPYVQILATSRERLSVECEQLHHLELLEIPDVSSGLSAIEALEFSAIQLFVERATNILGRFELRDIDVPIVIDICRRLDGLPLAIELAAASIDVLGLRGVLSRLADPLRLPAILRRAAPTRHRTLRVLLDWSYRLLSDEERRVLRRLSVFDHSFAMEEVTTVAADLTYTENAIVDQVTNLVAKSLVVAVQSGPDTRLRLLATTRAYAFEKLSESREINVIAQRKRHFPNIN